MSLSRMWIFFCWRQNCLKCLQGPFIWIWHPPSRLTVTTQCDRISYHSHSLPLNLWHPFGHCDACIISRSNHFLICRRWELASVPECKVVSCPFTIHRWLQFVPILLFIIIIFFTISIMTIFFLFSPKATQKWCGSVICEDLVHLLHAFS